MPGVGPAGSPCPFFRTAGLRSTGHARRKLLQSQYITAPVRTPKRRHAQLAPVPRSPDLSCCDGKIAVLRSPGPIAPVSYLWACFSMSSRPTSPRTLTARRAASVKLGDVRGGHAPIAPRAQTAPLVWANAPRGAFAPDGVFGDTLRPQRPTVSLAGAPRFYAVTISLKLPTANRPILGPAASSKTRIRASQSARRPRRAHADLHSAVDTLR